MTWHGKHSRVLVLGREPAPWKSKTWTLSPRSVAFASATPLGEATQPVFGGLLWSWNIAIEKQ